MLNRRPSGNTGRVSWETLDIFFINWSIHNLVLSVFLFNDALFLGPHLWHMEVPRRGVESEL